MCSVDRRLWLSQLHLSRGPRVKLWASCQLLFRDRRTCSEWVAMTTGVRALIFPKGAGYLWESPSPGPCGHGGPPVEMSKAAGPHKESALNFLPLTGELKDSKAGAVSCGEMSFWSEDSFLLVILAYRGES